jgi:hypothetical protein
MISGHDGLPYTAIDGLMAVKWMTRAKILNPCHHHKKRPIKGMMAFLEMIDYKKQQVT